MNMKLSASESRKNVLERLRNQEKSRDWAALSSHYSKEFKPRRWSAESGQDIHNGQQNLYKTRPGSPPQYLPRFNLPPYHHQQDLRSGKLGVVPPVKSPRKEAFIRKSNVTTANQYQLPETSSNVNNWQIAGTSVQGMPSMMVPYPNSQPPNTHLVQNAAPPYPAGLFPVPFYAGYAPMIPLQYTGGVPMGSFAFGGQVQQPLKRKMTRSEAATSIQKYYRGWKVRKSSRLLQLKWLSVPACARSFTEDLIEEFLIDEIVPDILIDVLSHKQTLAPHDPRYKLASYVCSEIISEDVSTFLDLIAASTYYSQVYIPSLPSHDPLSEIGQELVNKVVSESCLPIVQSTIDDLVASHMTEVKKDDLLEDLIYETISPMVYHVATMTLDVYKYEILVDGIIEEVTDELTQPVIKDAWKEVVTSHRSNQSQQVSNYAEGRLLDSLCLEHLLTHLAGNNLTLYFRDYMEQVMDGMICRVLTQQYMDVYNKQQEILENEALRELHLQLNTDVALEVIMDELVAHLDEDMQDWREKQEVADHEDCLL